MNDPCEEIVEIIETEQEMKEALFDENEIIVSLFLNEKNFNPYNCKDTI